MLKPPKQAGARDTEPGSFEYERGLLAENRMLLDYIGGSANRSITELQVLRDVAADGAGAAQDDKYLRVTEILERLGAIELKFDEIARGAEAAVPRTALLEGKDLAFLHRVRDALNSLVQPASGMTVAYTRMVTRGGGRRRPRDDLAVAAYPGLKDAARHHRFWIAGFVALALLATTLAVWESTKVALGKSLLSSLQELRLQQAAIAAERAALQSDPADPKKWHFPTVSVRDADGTQADFALAFCNNSAFRFHTLDVATQTKLRAWSDAHEAAEGQKTRKLGETQDSARGATEILVFKTPAELELCQKDTVLASRFGLFYAELRKYNRDWTAMGGRGFVLVQRIIDRTIDVLRMPLDVFWWGVAWLRHVAPMPGEARPIAASAPVGAPVVSGNDIEWVIVAQLMVLGNYVLPVIFSLLGAAAYVIVDYFRKVGSATLSPSDQSRALMRLVLGTVIGACIGLIYSASAPIPQPGQGAPSIGTLANTIAFSSSGITFLAGFGVEGVFKLLDALVTRVFATGAEPAARKEPGP